MLLWELCYRRIPYKEKSLNDILEHVMKGEREVLSSSSDSLLPGKNEIQEGLNEIIRMGS